MRMKEGNDPRTDRKIESFEVSWSNVAAVPTLYNEGQFSRPIKISAGNDVADLFDTLVTLFSALDLGNEGLFLAWFY